MYDRFFSILTFDFSLISLHTAHDESKDRDYELEISWVCTESDMKHQFVPAELLAEAKAYAEVVWIISMNGP